MDQYDLDIRSSATRHISDLGQKVKVKIEFGQNTQSGDAVIGQVAGIGQHSSLEDIYGHEILLHPGNICALVFERVFHLSSKILSYCFSSLLSCKYSTSFVISFLQLNFLINHTFIYTSLSYIFYGFLIFQLFNLPERNFLALFSLIFLF